MISNITEQVLIANSTKERIIYNICAEDSPGLVGQILAMFNRRRVNIKRVGASITSISETASIDIEVFMELRHAGNMRLQILKIIEVTSVEIFHLSPLKLKQC